MLMLFMLVPMFEIGIMSMCVYQLFMLMGMTVCFRDTTRKIMIVLIVFIMTVLMIMKYSFMHMLMFMLLCEM